MLRSIMLSVLLALALVGCGTSSSETDTTSEPSIEGATTYKGVLDVAGGIDLYFDIAGDSTDLTVALRVPVQTDQSIPASSVTQEGDTLVVDFSMINGRFDGAFDGDTLTGTWAQNGGSWPLVLEKVSGAAADAALNRPQEPKPPFPYASEEVTFPGGAEGVTLAGTLTRPEGAGPFPALITVTGSGPQDRNEALLGHKPFLVIADHLTKAGFAVLRYDDRGTASSTGDFAAGTSFDFTEDAKAALRFLSVQNGIDADHLYLLGHSEGGLIGPLVAADPDVPLTGLVLMAPPTVHMKEVLREQTRRAAILEGDSAELANTKGEQTAAFMDLLASFESIEEARAPATAWLDAQEMSDEDREQAKTRAMTPWFHAISSLDMTPYVTGLTVPTLALLGDKDFQVPSEQNAAPLMAAERQDLITIVRFPDANHLFQKADTGALSEYAQIEETIDPAVLKTMTDWLKAQTSPAP